MRQHERPEWLTPNTVGALDVGPGAMRSPRYACSAPWKTSATMAPSTRPRHSVGPLEAPAPCDGGTCWPRALRRTCWWWGPKRRGASGPVEGLAEARCGDPGPAGPIGLLARHAQEHGAREKTVIWSRATSSSRGRSTGAAAIRKVRARPLMAGAVGRQDTDLAHRCRRCSRRSSGIAVRLELPVPHEPRHAGVDSSSSDRGRAAVRAPPARRRGSRSERSASTSASAQSRSSVVVAGRMVQRFVEACRRTPTKAVRIMRRSSLSTRGRE